MTSLRSPRCCCGETAVQCQSVCGVWKEESKYEVVNTLHATLLGLYTRQLRFWSIIMWMANIDSELWGRL